MKDKILLTGRPGVGKSTVIAHVIERLDAQRLTGFYTRELRDERGRVGFEAVTLRGQRHTLAHADFDFPHRVSKYRVDVRGFDREIVSSIAPALHRGAKLIVIDEIGKMECFSARFRQAAIAAIESDIAVLGTIALRGGSFIRQIKSKKGVQIIEVTRRNRDKLAKELLEIYEIT